MKSLRTLAIVLAAAVVAIAAAAQSGEITVTATYKGKGVVDATHEILIFLFDHPDPTAESEPLALQTITKNGSAVTFKGLGTTPLYVVLVYDEQANYDGKAGPPPAGTPWATHSKGGKPVAVTPGPNVKVAATFDDSKRFK